MAFRRTLFKLAERADVQPALKKMWKKHYQVDGQISQHLSPLEQNIVSPLFKDLWSNLQHRIVGFLLEAGPGLGIGYFIFVWGDKKHTELAMHHRN